MRRLVTRYVRFPKRPAKTARSSKWTRPRRRSTSQRFLLTGTRTRLVHRTVYVLLSCWVLVGGAACTSGTSAATGGGGRGGRGRGGDGGAAVPVVTAAVTERDVPVNIDAIGNV